MTSLDRNQAPKTRAMATNRTALVASLDIGTSKIACMIARLRPCAPNEALRGRSHAVELIGYSQIQSRGVKSGAVVDLGECEQAVRQAVALAEKMAGHARSRGLTPTQLALGWVWNNTLVNGVIGGPKTLAQWQDYLGALDLVPDVEDEALVDSLVTPGHPSTPGYNDPAYPLEARRR